MFNKIDYEAMMRLRPAGSEDLRDWAKLSLAGLIYNPAIIAGAASAMNSVLPGLSNHFDPWNIASTGLAGLAGATSFLPVRL